MTKKYTVDFQGLKLLYLQDIIKISLLFFTIQFLIIQLDIPLYISCIYCPLIYLYKRNVNYRFIQKQDYKLIYKHFSLYLLIVITSTLKLEVFFLWLTLTYFLLYVVLIRYEIKKRAEVVYFSNSKNTISLFIYFIILAMGTIVLRITEIYSNQIFEVSADYIIKGNLLINMLFSIVSLISLQRKEINKSDDELVNVTSDLGIKILNFFETSDLYLKPNFKISQLANILDVKKEAISTVINHEMKMSYYNLVAKYRIKHAKEILLTQEQYTIESIVEQCGFHSRTTFNKYFHKFVGLKPSEFRKVNLSNLKK